MTTQRPQRDAAINRGREAEREIVPGWLKAMLSIAGILLITPLFWGAMYIIAPIRNWLYKHSSKPRRRAAEEE